MELISAIKCSVLPIYLRTFCFIVELKKVQCVLFGGLPCYSFVMYYWEERHSDILACAPRPRVARSTTKNHPRCLCHGQRWANATRGVIEALAKTQQQHLGAPPDADKVIQKQMCCCGNKLVNTGE